MPAVRTRSFTSQPFIFTLNKVVTSISHNIELGLKVSFPVLAQWPNGMIVIFDSNGEVNGVITNHLVIGRRRVAVNPATHATCTCIVRIVPIVDTHIRYWIAWPTCHQYLAL